MRLLVFALASLLALSACHRKSDPPSDAPTGVQVKEGDGLVLVTWDMLPDLTYWIFFQPGDSVTAAATGSIAIRGAVSPRVLAPLTNGTPYAFVMNATHLDSAAGPSSPVVLAKPRLAGEKWDSGPALGLPLPPQDLKSLAFSGSRFVAVGNAATIFWGDYSYASTATPGVTAWTPATLPQLPVPYTADLSSVVFNGQFIALGTDGSVVLSADGLMWASQVSVPAAGATMNGIAFAQVFGVTPTYVAVGNGGKIFTSSDLTAAWTPRDVSALTTNDLTSVSLLNGIFFVTGAAGTLLTSADGIIWTLQNSGTASTLRGATFSATAAVIHYVAVGDAGAVATSQDGASWTAIALPGAPSLQSVTAGGAKGSRFLAVGQGGVVFFNDDDGATWTPASAGSSNLAKVVAAPSLYLAVGAGGANAVSK